MKALLLTVALAFPVLAQDPSQPQGKGNQNLPAVKLDGEWTVTYAEMDGKKIDTKGITQVMIKNDVVTCKHEGVEKSWRLQFGPHHMVRCTEQIDGKSSVDKTQHTHHGMYIASQEYFCLSMNKGMDQRNFTTGQGREDAPQKERNPQAGTQQQRFGETTPTGANFVLILHRGTSTGSGR